MPTPPASPAAKTVRFGVFELDLASGELRRGGTRIRLQEQPFQVLAYLLQRPGDVVTREELRQKLWPADTFVDFDHSLNTAVNKVREALGDSAASPRYVETLARRGYRFLAPVERQGLERAENANADAVQFHPELEVPLPHRGLTRGLFVLIQIMYLVFYVVALVRWQEVDRVTQVFLSGWGSFIISVTVLVTACVGILLRCYLLSAAGFDYQRLREKFEQIFLSVLMLDVVWAVSPFLAVEKIGVGTAFAVTAGLVYVPFAQRTLLRMAYPATKKVTAA